MSDGLDPVIHPAHRLQLCAMLDAGTTLELTLVRERLGISPSALSKQVATLVGAGYVREHRDAVDARRLWLSITREGRRAYRAHIGALEAIIRTGAPG